MKQENKTRNKLIACLLCLVMIGATLFGAPWFSVQADDTTTSTTGGQSYGAWSEQLVTNGSFEVGYEGMEVYGWHKTVMQQNTHGKQTDESVIKTHNQNVTLKTELETDGNKVAAFKKTGAGIVAATSGKTEVLGGQEYRLSFDYRNKEISYANDTTTVSNYYGIRLYVEELAEDGTTATVEIQKNDTHYYADATYNENWSTGQVQFKTQADTQYVVIYLWMGGNPNVYTTVYFDNVLLEENDDYKVINGSFDDVTYLADGGRTAGVEGPVGWTMVGATSGGLITNGPSSYKNAFKATTAYEEGRGNVALVQLTEPTSGTGYAMLQSEYIPVNGIKKCHVAADCKLLMYTANGTEQRMSGNIYLNVACYDANKGLLGESTVKQDAGTDLEWEKWFGEFSTIDGTQYIKVGLYVNFVRGHYSTNVDAASQFEMYYDNVVLDVENESLGYTQVSTGNRGLLSDGTYTQNYGIQKINAGVGYENAVQLYVVKETGGEGATTFYSEPFAVTAGKSHQIALDYKIEGVEDSSKNHGADVVLRYKNAEGEYINETPGAADEVRLNANNTDNKGWTHLATAFEVPEDAVTAEVGLLIGVTTANCNGNMKNTFANIAVAPLGDASWSEYNKRGETDLLFKMLEEGNANEELTVDVCDLVRMKKYFSDNTVTIAETADMNKNSVINESNDLRLLRWKLLGVTTTADAQAVQQ